MVEQRLGRPGGEQFQVVWPEFLLWTRRDRKLLVAVLVQLRYLGVQAGQRFDRKADLSKVGDRLLVCEEAGAVVRRCGVGRCLEMIRGMIRGMIREMVRVMIRERFERVCNC